MKNISCIIYCNGKINKYIIMIIKKKIIHIENTIKQGDYDIEEEWECEDTVVYLHTPIRMIGELLVY